MGWKDSGRIWNLLWNAGVDSITKMFCEKMHVKLPSGNWHFSHGSLYATLEVCDLYSANCHYRISSSCHMCDHHTIIIKLSHLYSINPCTWKGLGSLYWDGALEYLNPCFFLQVTALVAYRKCTCHFLCFPSDVQIITTGKHKLLWPSHTRGITRWRAEEHLTTA